MFQVKNQSIEAKYRARAEPITQCIHLHNRAEVKYAIINYRQMASAFIIMPFKLLNDLEFFDNVKHVVILPDEHGNKSHIDKPLPKTLLSLEAIDCTINMNCIPESLQHLHVSTICTSEDKRLHFFNNLKYVHFTLFVRDKMYEEVPITIEKIDDADHFNALTLHGIHERLFLRALKENRVRFLDAQKIRRWTTEECHFDLI